MRFLIDNNPSYRLAEFLAAAHHDAVHIRDYEMQAADDELVFQRAIDEERILISADADFSQLLAIHGASKPSLIAWRWSSLRDAEKQATVIINNLPEVEAELEQVCIVVIEESRLRIRSLPIHKGD